MKNMLDWLFKLYFSVFRNRGEKGVNAALVWVTMLLSMFSFIVFILILSFFGILKSIGAAPMAILAGLVVYAVQLAVGKRFADSKRYEKMEIKHPASSCFLGLIIFFLATIAFAIGIIKILS